MYFDYPLEQGLRRRQPLPQLPEDKYFDYPLEQGLRLNADRPASDDGSILIIH